MSRYGRTNFEGDSIGGDVYTSDGEELGRVWDVQDASFQVDVPFESDYWLPFNTVASADAERITLTFPRAELDHYKSHDPLVA